MAISFYTCQTSYKNTQSGMGREDEKGKLLSPFNNIHFFHT